MMSSNNVMFTVPVNAYWGMPAAVVQPLPPENLVPPVPVPPSQPPPPAPQPPTDQTSVKMPVDKTKKLKKDKVGF